MLITDTFIFLDLHKTGCTHIRRLIKKTIGGKIEGIHNSVDIKPKDKYLVGSIRDPWEWYVSLWSFGCMKNAGVRAYLAPPRNHFRYIKRMIKRRHLDKPKNADPFYDHICIKIIRDYYRYYYWNRLYSDVNNVANFRKWLIAILDNKRSHLPDIYKQSGLSTFCGFYTFRYFRVLYPNKIKKKTLSIDTYNKLKSWDDAHNPIDFFIRNENLEQDLEHTLEAIGYTLSKDMLHAIYSSKRTNQSHHLTYETYYDAQTLALVNEKEKFIIEKFGYKPPHI